MNPITLQTMTEDQFSKFRLMASEQYAGTSPFYSTMPLPEALESILKDFDTRLAPKGLKTLGQHFVAIQEGDQQIGYFHFGEFPKGSKSAYAWNFHIFEAHQRQGHAKVAIELAKSFLKNLGYQKISLNVMAENIVAIGLYEKFGFKVTQLNMERKID